MDKKEYRSFIFKEYAIWGTCWGVILATYIIFGVKLGIFSFVFLPYIIVGIIIGAFVLRTHIKVKTALMLLEDFAQSLSESLANKEEIE